MPGPITVNDLVDQVRDQLDESNQDDVTQSDILQALNRAQRRAANILVKKNEDFFIAPTTVTTTATDTYDLPEDSFGRRLDQVLVVRDQREYPLKRVSYRELWKYTSSASVSQPYVYATRGREYTVKPTPQAGVSLKLWYSKAPETLVLPQGRITSVTAGSGGSVALDALGSDLTVSTDALGAFVNIVDAQTGEIKVSLQVSAINTSTKIVTFKASSLTYSTLYGRTIATTVPTTVDSHDYVCAVQGTCVPDLPDACDDYLIQYAVYEIRRRMGEVVQDDAEALKVLEQDLERQWVGREASRQIVNRARHWSR
jgi:hypothetical protein